MTAAPLWQASVLTLFPDMFPGPLGGSLPGRALDDGIWSLRTFDIRSFATDRHRTVDDTPYGGGAGMVMRPDVLMAAITKAEAELGRPHERRIYLSPRGRVWNQAMAADLAKASSVLMLCGRYEGVDQRLLDEADMDEVSLGDFVLFGGEVAAMAMMESCVRLLPGVLGNEATVDEESFANGLLEYPHYTRPPVWQDRAVPDVLISGHHEKVNAWRLEQAKALTASRRPDLWDAYVKEMTALEAKKAPKSHRND